MTERNAVRYAHCMPQVVVRMEQGLIDTIDALVAEGIAESRSELTRRAVLELADRHRRQATGRLIAEEYATRPQTDAEIGWSDSGTVAMIAEEPW